MPYSEQRPTDLVSRVAKSGPVFELEDGMDSVRRVWAEERTGEIVTKIRGVGFMALSEAYKSSPQPVGELGLDIDTPVVHSGQISLRV